MLLFIGGDVLAHWWRCVGSLVEMYCLIGGHVLAHWLRCVCSLLEMRALFYITCLDFVYSSLFMLFYFYFYLGLLQNNAIVTSQCMHYIFC